VSIVLARIDDRLVHGQVVLAWGESLAVTRILVADDEVAANPWERELMGAVAEGLQIEVVPLRELPDRLEIERGRKDITLLLFRTPQSARTAIDAGANLAEINLGGLHYADGKDRVLDYLYLDEHDRSDLRALQERGVRLIAQDVPTSRPIEAREFLVNGEGV
jgi:mannose/fructose/N-acetylgalactosamine-specific phosphotransferase system component IIB